jgi:hypothetical protein
MFDLTKTIKIQLSKENDYVQDGENKYYTTIFYYLRSEDFIDLTENDTALCDIKAFKNELLKDCMFNLKMLDLGRGMFTGNNFGFASFLHKKNSDEVLIQELNFLYSFFDAVCKSKTFFSKLQKEKFRDLKIIIDEIGNNKKLLPSQRKKILDLNLFLFFSRAFNDEIYKRIKEKAIELRTALANHPVVEVHKPLVPEEKVSILQAIELGHDVNISLTSICLFYGIDPTYVLYYINCLQSKQSINVISSHKLGKEKDTYFYHLGDRNKKMDGKIKLQNPNNLTISEVKKICNKIADEQWKCANALSFNVTPENYDIAEKIVVNHAIGRSKITNFLFCLKEKRKFDSHYYAYTRKDKNRKKLSYGKTPLNGLQFCLEDFFALKLKMAEGTYPSCYEDIPTFLFEWYKNEYLPQLEPIQKVKTPEPTHSVISISTPTPTSTPPIYSQYKSLKEWNGHYFRHESEIEIAKELDKRQITFFPNAGCRTMNCNQMISREPDFLIVYKGKVGILELDGSSHCKSVVLDHQKDRLFKKQGINVVEHYPSEMSPSAILDDFLQILDVS